MKPARTDAERYCRAQFERMTKLLSGNLPHHQAKPDTEGGTLEARQSRRSVPPSFPNPTEIV
jgi:hypothetical protein